MDICSLLYYHDVVFGVVVYVLCTLLQYGYYVDVVTVMLFMILILFRCFYIHLIVVISSGDANLMSFIGHRVWVVTSGIRAVG